MAPDQNKWEYVAPLVIAHRGASLIAPENTIPAFERAFEMGADAIELDVKLSRDGVLVVFHDQILSRTTNGEGQLYDWDWEDLQRLDAGSHHGQAFSNVGIPRLEDVFEHLEDRVLYNIELTEYQRWTTDLTVKTIRMVSRYGLQDNVLYSSFNPLELLRASRLVHKEAIALLMHEKTPAILRVFERMVVPYSSYHPYDGLVTREMVQRIKRAGKRINVWTVNEEERIGTLLSWGVDGIITDLPDRAIKIRDELQGNR
jgi:glycerophosphoryl diester phosphodiesterase